MFSAFLLTVNQKKDSENTPVKGGTVADLGEFSLFICCGNEFDISSDEM